MRVFLVKRRKKEKNGKTEEKERTRVRALYHVRDNFKYHVDNIIAAYVMHFIDNVYVTIMRERERENMKRSKY